MKDDSVIIWYDVQSSDFCPKHCALNRYSHSSKKCVPSHFTIQDVMLMQKVSWATYFNNLEAFSLHSLWVLALNTCTGNENTYYWNPIQGEKVIYQNKVDLALASFFVIRVANRSSHQYKEIGFFSIQGISRNDRNFFQHKVWIVSPK